MHSAIPGRPYIVICRDSLHGVLLRRDTLVVWGTVPKLLVLLNPKLR